MGYKYLHIGRASELQNPKDRRLYRFFEILPGALSWGTLVLVVVLSWKKPVWAAFFIIAFDLYWLVKTIYLSAHLRANARRLKNNMKLDWGKRLDNLKHGHIRHLILLPFYKEGPAVLTETLDALLDSKYDHAKMFIVLCYEERAGAEAEKTAYLIREKYAQNFGRFILVKHPKDLPGEMAGKGSNIAYGGREAKKIIVDAQNILYENIIVSAFDIDTHVYPQYFSCLAWHYLTALNPHRSSFQPVPLYNNNIWDAPALSRVIATSGTFWQMIQQERPERLATFSSHSMSFKALNEVGFWQRNIVSEDSRIFWNSLLFFDGDYQVIPMAYPISLDANFTSGFWRTALNNYKQQRRWTWGVENVPYLLFGCARNKMIPLKKRLRLAFVQLEGFWSLATNPLIIFFLGWLPLALGGTQFNKTLLSYNLPRLTRDLMAVAMLGLVVSVAISLSFLPPRPPGKRRRTYFYLVFQWLMIPLTIPLLGAVPGLDSQTRLMLGKYMGFWVTPKFRRDPKTEKLVPLKLPSVGGWLGEKKDDNQII